MASALEIRRQAFRDLLDRDLFENDINMAGGEGGLQSKYGNDSYEAQKAEIMNSPEYRNVQSPEYQKAKFAREQAAARQALLDRQKAEEEGLFGQYQGKIAGQEKLSSAYTRLADERGLSTLKGQFNTTRDLLDRLDSDVTDRTSGTLTSESQRRRQIAAETEPLAANLGRLGTAIGSATEDVGTQLQFMAADQAKELDPIKMRIAATSDRFAREITGFDTEQQTGLNFLLDKLNRDRQLTDMEWSKAADLAKMQEDFGQKKALLQIQFENDMKMQKASGGGSGSGAIFPAAALPAAGGTTEAAPVKKYAKRSEAIVDARGAFAAGIDPVSIYQDLISGGIPADAAAQIIGLVKAGR